jgi:hypothetical protein
LLTLADTIKDIPLSQIIPKFESLPLENKLGQYTCYAGWCIKRELFGGHDSFKATDVCWIYPEKKKFAEFATWQIYMKTPEREITFSHEDLATSGAEQSMPQATESCMKTLYSIIPWAFYGFDMLIDIAWRSHNNAWLKIVGKRVNAIKTGISNGSLLINADGLIQVTDRTFHMPSMNIDDRGRIHEV